MNKKFRVWLAVIATSMAVAGSASAQTDLTIYVDTYYTGYITVTPGVQGGVSGTVGINNEDVYLTAFQATYAGGNPLPYPTPDPFITFCVDILPDLVNWNNGIYSSWTPETFSAASPSPNGSGQTIPYVNGGLTTAANLYNAFVGNIGVLNNGRFTGGGTINNTYYSGEQWSAAVQLAIWRALYGSSFSATGVDPTVATLESDILGSTYNVANPNLTSTFWNATNPSDNQDLIGPQMQTGFVPESGAYGVLASAGLLVVVLRTQLRRKLA
jgi:hypothetical protein